MRQGVKEQQVEQAAAGDTPRAVPAGTPLAPSPRSYMRVTDENKSPCHVHSGNNTI